MRRQPGNRLPLTTGGTTMTFRVERLGEYRVVEHADARDGYCSRRVYDRQMAAAMGRVHGLTAACMGT